ncbi:MAG: MauE/DoxX family redox-associated membrane protein [Patescibacteria group bacterium]
MNKFEHEQMMKAKPSITPLLAILGGVVLITLIWSAVTGLWDALIVFRIFMGVFFVTFSVFKLLDLKGFAQAYATYDVVAKKVSGYGFFYPFIELWLGVNYLFHLMPRVTDWVTFLVMGISSVGVLLALQSKKPFRCACLGTKINVPMTTVTLLEDLLMTVMAGIMLLWL